MIRANEEILRSMIALQGNPHWEIVIAWMRESYSADMDALVENTIFRSGMAAELYDLLRQVRDARINLEKLKF
jgi:hypothetical protein